MEAHRASKVFVKDVGTRIPESTDILLYVKEIFSFVPKVAAMKGLPLFRLLR